MDMVPKLFGKMALFWSMNVTLKLLCTVQNDTISLKMDKRALNCQIIFYFLTHIYIYSWV